MIKRFNQFVKDRVNEEFVMAPSKPETQEPTVLPGTIRPGTQQPTEPQPPSIIPDHSEEDAPAKAFYGEEEEEGNDIFAQSLQNLSDMLGVPVQNGQINYHGKKIIFPAETEMYHVDKKKFKTAEEVVNYLEGSTKQEEIRDEMSSIKDDQMIDNLEEQFESKSYKFKRSKRK